MRVSASDEPANSNTGDLTLSGTAPDYMTVAAGLPEAAAEHTDTPSNDGVEDLLKYAFNMNLAGCEHAATWQRQV